MYNVKVFARIAMVVVIVAAFLPWEQVFIYSQKGIDGDGQLTLGAAIVGFALTFWKNRVSDWLVLVLAAGCSLVGLYHVGDTYASSGVYLTALGGLAWLTIAAYGLYTESRRVEIA